MVSNSRSTFAAAALCALTAHAFSAVAAPTPCSELAGTAIPAANISLPTRGAIINTALVVPATPPGPTAVGEYCKVDGGILPVDVTAPQIRFQVNLPTAWNGKALQFGGGGYNGTIPIGTGNVPAGPVDRPTPLGRGYTTFASDSGHQAASPFLETIPSLDARFGVNNEALRNFAGDALKKTRDVAAYVIRLHYGRHHTLQYFAGGSTGGREALAVVLRWPRAYDGSISWYPAWNAASLNLFVGNLSRVMAQPGAYPNDAKKKLLYDATIAACDALDGLKDGVISNVARCRFDPQTLRCPGGDDTGNTCLSDVQIAAFNTYSSTLSWSYRTGSGENHYPGFNVYAGADTRGFLQLNTKAPAQPPEILTMPYMFNFWDGWVKHFVTRDPTFDSLQLDPVNPGVWKRRIAALLGIQDVNSTDLDVFERRGGKLLIAHGTADALVNNRATQEYYERLIDRYGRRELRSFVRYFEAPGYGHAIFGSFIPGWDSLTALEDWVERGIPPRNQIMTDTVAATRGRTRPLCEYPNWPRFVGGDAANPNDASSFVCARGPRFRAEDEDDDDLDRRDRTRR
jgi:hypothetical protein